MSRGAARVRRVAAAGAAAVPLCLFAPGGSRAFIPRAERVEEAISETNTASSRASALLVEFEMRISGGEPVARGELVTHPQGLARLELRAANGLVERHILQGNDHRASRDGRRLRRPRPFLPPLFLLQADSPTTLRAAFAAFGGEAERIGLAPCGLRDCYVIGDPALQPPPPAPEPMPDLGGPPPPPPPSAPARTLSDDERSARRRRDERPTRIWADTETLEIRRIDLPEGVVVRLGPVAAFDSIRFPSWIQIEEPDERVVRFRVTSAVSVNAPAAAFGDGWLEGSAPSEERPAGAAPGPDEVGDAQESAAF